MTRPPDSDAPDRAAGHLTPGLAVGGGRYRLLAQVGADPRVQASFWRAHDAVLDRDVAITALTGPDAARSLQFAAAIGQLQHRAIAWLLDIIDDPTQLGPQLSGLIVTEWIPGADLATVTKDATNARRTLSTAAIARALSPLADAVHAAHRAGLVLGCDHPDRIRIGTDGVARLAFPAAPASDLPADDVRGLGAALYLLLTGRWPLPGSPPGLLAAPASSTGVPLPPQSLRPTVSPTLATLAERCLAGAAANGVYNGAAVHHLLEQVSNAEAETTHIPRIRDGGPTDWQDEADEPRRPDHRRRKLAIALTVLAVLILGFFGWLGRQVVSFLSDDGTSSAPTLVVTPTAGAAPSPGEPAPAGPIQAAGVKVFDVTGDPDNPNRVNRLVDGNPRTSWKTYDYNQPFPRLKSGVGVLVSFAEPVTLAAVYVDSASEGSTVEIRTAPSGDAGLTGSTVLGAATLGNGRTEIKLNAAPPSQQLLLWITGLAQKGGKHSTELTELTFLRAG